MLQECQRKSDHETGGILIGAYSGDLTTANVEEATAPPTDSRAFPTRFFRGIGGLVALLQLRWQYHGRYYLGEWHYHPHAAPLPSAYDRQQMADIANDPDYSCRHPLLVIVGGNPAGDWHLYASVYSGSEQRLIELSETSGAD